MLIMAALVKQKPRRAKLNVDRKYEGCGKILHFVVLSAMKDARIRHDKTQAIIKYKQNIV